MLVEGARGFPKNQEEEAMKSIVKLGLAAALALGASSAVLAQNTVQQPGAMSDDAPIAAPNPNAATNAAGSLDTTTTGSIGNTIDSLSAGLSAGASADLSAITDASTVNFVTVSSLQGDPAALDTAIQGQTDALTKLHASVDANTALKAKLDAAGYSTDDVLAVQTGADGAVTVYIDDRA
jgi:hypothetical protein